jgi:hypothetical protein
MNEKRTNPRGEPKTVVVWQDIDYAARVWLTPEWTHVAEFKLWEVSGLTHLEGKPLYGDYSPDYTENPDEVEPFVAGGIKWDGCANFEFGEPEVCVHWCGPNDVRNFAEAMLRVYRLAKDIMEAAGNYVDFTGEL